MAASSLSMIAAFTTLFAVLRVFLLLSYPLQFLLSVKPNVHDTDLTLTNLAQCSSLAPGVNVGYISAVKRFNFYISVRGHSSVT